MSTSKKDIIEASLIKLSPEAVKRDRAAQTPSTASGTSVSNTPSTSSKTKVVRLAEKKTHQKCVKPTGTIYQGNLSYTSAPNPNLPLLTDFDLRYPFLSANSPFNSEQYKRAAEAAKLEQDLLRHSDPIWRAEAEYDSLNERRRRRNKSEDSESSQEKGAKHNY